MTDTEQKEVDGRIYARSIRPGGFWKFASLVYRGSNAAGMSEFDKQADDGRPHVLCPCGSLQFTLRYGYYELFAKCAACGAEECVYDG